MLKIARSRKFWNDIHNRKPQKVGAGLAHGLAEAREAEDEGLEDRRALVVGDEAGAQERPDLGEAFRPDSEPTTGLRGA